MYTSQKSLKAKMQNKNSIFELVEVTHREHNSINCVLCKLYYRNTKKKSF